MKVRGHLKILGIVSAAWAIFWLIGWPDYYRQYSFRFMLLFDIAILIPLWLLMYWLLIKTRAKYRTSLSLWLAFYITIPLLLFDYLYCGVYLKYGWYFLVEFWYISVYYVLPWILCPLTAIGLNKIATQKNNSMRLY